MLRRILNPIIGLGAEAHARHQKNKKESSDPSEEGSPVYESFDTNPPPDEPAAESAPDEADWELDEAVPEAESHPPARSCVPKGKAGGPASINDIVNAFLAAYPVKPTSCGLPCPVIIPQKRPGNKTRGFVRAYAPALEAVGIDERTWMDFMRCFEEAIRVSPVFDAVNIGVSVLGLAQNAFPSPALMAAITAITAADIAAQRAYQRGRYNDFLAQLNAKFFQPLGLYCLIMTYDPHRPTGSQPWDLATAVAKSENDADATGVKLKWKTLKGVTGSTQGEAQMPQAAELIYPAVDATLDLREGEKPPGWWSRSTAFVGEYMDKRAQAHYASLNPDTVLAMQPEFESSLGAVGTSRLSPKERHRRRMDALHEGGLRAYGQQARYQARDKTHRTKEGEHPPPLEPGQGMRVRRHGGGGGPLRLLVTAASGGKLQGRDARPINVVKRVVKPGVMYLMVTTMPTPEQLAAAREEMEVEP